MDRLTEKSIINALKDRAYLLRAQYFDIAPDGKFPISFAVNYYLIATLYYKLLRYMIMVKNILGKSGVKIPKYLMNLGRNIFSK